MLRLLALSQSALHQEALVSHLKASKPSLPEGLHFGSWGHSLSAMGILEMKKPV